MTRTCADSPPEWPNDILADVLELTRDPEPVVPPAEP